MGCNFLKVFSLYLLNNCMQLRKEILFLYLLLIVSVGVIIAADQPRETPVKKPNVKCCKIPGAVPPALPLNTITEGILRYKA